MPRKRPAWKRLLRPRDVAVICDVEPETVAAWARDGKLKGVRTPGGQWRFRESDVESLGVSVEEHPATGRAS